MSNWDDVIEPARKALEVLIAQVMVCSVAPRPNGGAG